jgi:hypothetical protein
MPFRVLDEDPQVYLLRLRSRLMLQHDLRRPVGFVEGFEQAGHEVGRARAADADDSGIAVGQPAKSRRIDGGVGIEGSQPAISRRRRRARHDRLGWVVLGEVGDHGEAGNVIGAGRQGHDSGLEVALDGSALADVGVGEDAPVPARQRLLGIGRELGER